MSLVFLDNITRQGHGAVDGFIVKFNRVPAKGVDGLGHGIHPLSGRGGRAGNTAGLFGRTTNTTRLSPFTPLSGHMFDRAEIERLAESEQRA